MSAAQQLEERGMERGMHSRSLDIARSMLNDSEPIEKIQRWTGLKREEICGVGK